MGARSNPRVRRVYLDRNYPHYEPPASGRGLRKERRGDVRMEMVRKLEPLALFLMVLGAINWGILGLTDGGTNVFSEIFGTGTLLNVVYVIVGVSALVLVPRLMDELHIGHGPHPRGV